MAPSPFNRALKRIALVSEDSSGQSTLRAQIISTSGKFTEHTFKKVGEVVSPDLWSEAAIDKNAREHLDATVGAVFKLIKGKQYKELNGSLQAETLTTYFADVDTANRYLVMSVLIRYSVVPRESFVNHADAYLKALKGALESHGLKAMFGHANQDALVVLTAAANKSVYEAGLEAHKTVLENAARGVLRMAVSQEVREPLGN